MTLTTHEEEKLRQALALVVDTTPVGRDFEELEQVRLNPVIAPRRRRTTRIAITAVAFAAVVGLMAPITLLLTGDGNGPTVTPPASTDPTLPDAGESGLPVVSLGDPLWQRDGDEVMLGEIVATATGFLVNGTENTHALPWPVYTLTSPDGLTWTQAWAQPGFDMLGPVASNGTTTLALGASSGDASTLYRWNPDVPTWDPIELPLPEGAIRAVAQLPAVIDRGWLVVGLATPSSFDDRTDVVAWRSTDTIDWITETIADDVGAVFYAGEVIDTGDGETVVGFARIGELEGERPPHPIVFETDSQGEWAMTDLTTLVVDDGQIGPGMVNLQLVDAKILDGNLYAWWLFDNGQGDDTQRQMVVTLRTDAGTWSATSTAGPFPTRVTPFGGELIAIQQPADWSFDRAASVLLRSTDGITWEPIGTTDGIALRHLVALGTERLLATGAIPDPGDSQANRGGIWAFEPPPGN